MTDLSLFPLQIVSNPYGMAIISIVLIAIVTMTITSTITFIYILFTYETTICNWFKHSIQQMCGFLISQIYNYNASSQRTINKYGSYKIVGLTIYRQPIPSLVNTTLNIISLGKWNEERNKDKTLNTLYHLTLACELEGGIIVYCQKNEVICISTDYSPTAECETCPIVLDNLDNLEKSKKISFTLNEMLNKTQERMGESNYFLYRTFDNNCQVYIKNLLESVDLYGSDIQSFVFQNIDAVLPKLNSVVNIFTAFIIWVATLTNKFFNMCFETREVRQENNWKRDKRDKKAIIKEEKAITKEEKAITREETIIKEEKAIIREERKIKEEREK